MKSGRALGRFVALLLAGVVLAWAGSARADGFEIPLEHHAWGRFKTGSWVRLKRERFTKGPGDEQKLLLSETTTTTLTAADADGYLLSGEKRQGGAEPQREETKLAWDGLPQGAERKLKLSIGEIKLAGRSIACQTHELTLADGPEPRFVKLWYTSDRAPYVLRRQLRSTAPPEQFSSWDLTEFDVREQLLGQERVCHRAKLVDTSAVRALLSTQLFCLDVPGGLVSSESEEREKRTGQIVLERVTLEAFEAAK